MSTTRQANVVQSGVGLSVPSVLGIIFIVLKLTGVISWSWLWVLAPFWIPFAVAVLFGVVFLGLIRLGTKGRKY